MSDSLEYAIAGDWVSAVNDAFSKADVDAFTACIAPDGWLRDILVFRPSLETRRGHALIKDYLANTFAKAGVGKLSLDGSPCGRPKLGAFGPDIPVIEAAFDFETPRAIGKGHVRIIKSKDAEEMSKNPQALIVAMVVSEWKGYEEPGHEEGMYDGHKLSWSEVRARRIVETERDPYVLVVGGAQSGLQIAARLQQNGFKTLLIEQTTRIGDLWRQRYPTLTLHTPRMHHCFLYQPFPSNWPTFTPRDKLADWMEQYAITQDLVVWTSSTIEPTPVYNESTKRWTVTVKRNSVPVILHPAHIVLAMGVFGDARMPTLPGAETFPGSIIHSSAFEGGAPYKNQCVLVVGAGNSAGDVCQDLQVHGAKEVTIVQRSSTAVISLKFLMATFGALFTDEIPTYYADLAYTIGAPYGAIRELSRSLKSFQEELDKELLDGFRKTSFSLKGGKDFVGQPIMVYERFGGYLIDVGCGQLIIDGKVKVKQGVEIERLTADGVVYTDGTTQNADVIIFATGWHPVAHKLRRIFGSETIDRMQDIWGGDEYGELRAGYKYSGVPGLYVAAGDFPTARVYSKFLALYFKGLELGYFPPYTTKNAPGEWKYARL